MTKRWKRFGGLIVGLFSGLGRVGGKVVGFIWLVCGVFYITSVICIYCIMTGKRQKIERTFKRYKYKEK